MKAAIYCRLSKEDEDKIGESESIQNQKSMLLQYALEKGFDIYQIYSDEDYSGIDRNRPAFNSMLQAASEHQFDVVLAKTQSRFTRDMELVEKYLHGKFMEWGIRFIAVVDHVDTNDTANKKSRQINGLINEWYLEDLSTNVRSVLDHKRKEGLFIGSFARYGYCKDPNAKGKLIIDPEAAEVVRRIFSMALNGIGAHKIARILNDEKIPSPTAYKQLHGIHYRSALKNTNAALWSSPTVYQILHDQLYIGNMVQGKHTKISYKSEKTIWLPKSQWIVVENTHEAIIEREMFETVQRMMQERTRSGEKGTIHPLAKKWFVDAVAAAWSKLAVSRERMEHKDAMFAAGCTSAHRKCAATGPVQIWTRWRMLYWNVSGRMRQTILTLKKLPFQNRMTPSSSESRPGVTS